MYGKKEVLYCEGPDLSFGVGRGGKGQKITLFV